MKVLSKESCSEVRLCRRYAVINDGEVGKKRRSRRIIMSNYMNAPCTRCPHICGGGIHKTAKSHDGTHTYITTTQREARRKRLNYIDFPCPDNYSIISLVEESSRAGIWHGMAGGKVYEQQLTFSNALRDGKSGAWWYFRKVVFCHQANAETTKINNNKKVRILHDDDDHDTVSIGTKNVKT